MRFFREIASYFDEIRRGVARFSISPVAAVALPVGAILLPVALYFWFIARNGVNVPRWDDWEIIPIASGLLHGNLSASMLWSQHNENRMPVAYLFDLLFTRWGNLNFRALMFFSASLIVVAYGLLAWSYFRGRRFGWWALVPVAFIGFSLAQHDNPLWGFQIAWYLVTVCLAATLYCLITVEEGTQWKLIGAIAAAAVGSFCSFQGLLIWPAGAVVLLLRNGRRGIITLWALAAVAVAFAYFAGFNLGATGGGSVPEALARPDRFVPFLLVQVGSVAAGTIPASPWGYAGLGIFGFLLLAVSAVVVVSAWRRRPDPQLALASALIVFALLFDILVYIGRSASGVFSATTSRYTTYNLLLLLGNYFGLLALLRLTVGPELRRIKVIAATFAALLTAQVAASSGIGLSVGEAQRIASLQSDEITRNYLDATPNQVQTYEYPNVEVFRKLAALAQRDRLSTFSNAGRCDASQGWAPHLSSRQSHGSVDPMPLSADGSLLLYVNGNRGASEAWRVLSDLYIKRPDLAASYPAWGITFPSSLLAWAGTPSASTYARGALTSYQTEYRSMFDVAKRSLAEGHHAPDLPYVVMPVPAALSAMLLESDRAVEAWRVLSILYFERQDLVRAFPGIDPEFPKQYVDWAVNSAKSEDVDGTGSLLRGYTVELRAMQNVMASAPHQPDGLASEGVLPAPRSLNELLASDPATYAAWMLVSAAYRSDREPHPISEANSECLALNLVSWAGRVGSSQPLFLTYAGQISRMRDALER